MTQIDFDRIDPNTIGDIVAIRTPNKRGIYSSLVDHENKLIATKVIFEVENTESFDDICKDLGIDHFKGDEDEQCC